jgi:hypothetical protein
MLELVTAERFDRRMSSGKTWPCQLDCVRTDGSNVELVAKFSAGCERRLGGLVVEAIAAMLAADLDLPVPEPLLVSFDNDFIQCLPAAQAELAQRLRASSPVAFGSSKLPPGFSVPPIGKTIPVAVRQQAAEIFAFDCLIQNPDRRPDNPNLLFDGRSFAIFDHELALITTGIIGWQPPWKVGSLQAINGDRHVLFAELSGRTYDLTRLEGAWQAITDQRLENYRKALPVEWVDDAGAAGQALGFIAELRDNIRPALAEIVRVLA